MLTKAKNNTRVQILMTEPQKEFLHNTSSEAGISISALVRNIVNQYWLGQREQQLEEAAQNLYSEYVTNKDLTAFTSLDAEDFH